MTQTDAKSKIYYINLGGTVGNVGSFKFAWRGRPNAYDNIGGELGVKTAKDTDSGLLFGMNNPQPAQVRISYVGPGGSIRTAVRFCEPDKLSAVTTGGKLNGKKIKIGSREYNINSVAIKSD